MRLIKILFFLLISAEVFGQTSPIAEKGSDLDVATTPTGSEYVIGLQGGHTKKFPWSYFSGGGGGAIASVFGRTTSAITAQSSDYASFYYPLGSNPAHFITVVTQAMIRRFFIANSPLNYDTASATFSLQYASGSQPGGITAANFSTFNNKENVLYFYSGLSRSGNIVRGKIVGTDTGMVTPAQKVLWDGKQDAINFAQNKIAGRVSSGSGPLEQISLSSQFALISGVLTYTGRTADSTTFNHRAGPYFMPMTGDYTYDMVGAYPASGNPSNFEFQTNKAVDMSVINDVKYVTTGLLKRQIDSLRAAGVIFTCSPPLRFGSGGSGLVALIDNTGHPIVDPLGNQLYAYEAGTNLQIDTVNQYTSGIMTPYGYYLLTHPAAETDPFYTNFGVPKTTTISVNGSVPKSLSSNVSITIPLGGRADSVSSGNLAGLFNTSVSFPTTNPTIGFSLLNQSPYKVYASQVGITGTPSFRSLVPNDIPVLDFTSKISGKPTTKAGYGITDMYSQTEVNNIFNGTTVVSGYNKVAWDAIAAKTKLGQFINDVGFISSETDPLSMHLTGSYADPSCITSLSKSKIIGLIDPVNPDWNATSGLPLILNKPSIPTKTRVYAGTNTVVSGTADSVVINVPGGGGGGGGTGITSGSLVMPAGFTVAGSPSSGTTFSFNVSTSLTGPVHAAAGAFSAGPILLNSEVANILPLANGGTNSSTPSGARTNLGLAIGTNVQAYNQNLDGLSTLSTNGFVKRTGTGTFTAANLVIGDIPDLSSIYALAGVGNNPFSDAANLVKNATDPTKLLRFSAASLSTGSTRTLTAQNASYILAGTNIANTFSADQGFGSGVKIKGSAHPENYITMDDAGDFITINSPHYIELISNDGVDGFSQIYINPASTGFYCRDPTDSYGVSFDATPTSIRFAANCAISTYNQKVLSVDTTGFYFNNGKVIPPSGAWNYTMPEKSGTFAMLSDISGLGSGTLNTVGLSQTGSEFSFSNNPLTSNGNIGIALNTNGVVYSKIQRVSTGKILGNPTGSTANVSEIGINNTLNFTGTNLGVNPIYLATPDTTGTTLDWSNGLVYPNGTQTLKIPMANKAGVVAGLINHTDYLKLSAAFANEITNITNVGKSGPAIKTGATLNIPDYSPIPWVTSTSGTVAMVGNHNYTANGTSQITYQLPTTSAVNDIITISGQASGGWIITQGAGQVIHFTSISTTVGSTGYIESTDSYTSIQIRCSVANTEWVVMNNEGTLTKN